jgi:hypothetical protein
LRLRPGRNFQTDCQAVSAQRQGRFSTEGPIRGESPPTRDARHGHSRRTNEVPVRPLTVAELKGNPHGVSAMRDEAVHDQPDRFDILRLAAPPAELRGSIGLRRVSALRGAW